MYAYGQEKMKFVSVSYTVLTRSYYNSTPRRLIVKIIPKHSETLNIQSMNLTFIS